MHRRQSAGICAARDGVWSDGNVKLDEKIVNEAGHTDATPAGCIVPFDVNTCKFVAGHVQLDPMELLERWLKCSSPTYSTPKSSMMRQNWMGRHLWRQRPGVDSAS
jgi:hypothetical protein